MSLDYIALAQWGLVPALGAIMGITITLSYYIFYNKIIEKEKEIRKTITKDLRQIVKQFAAQSNTNDKTEKQLSADVGRIMKIREMLEEAKSMFKKWLLFSAIALLILGIAYIVWTDQRNALFVVGIGLLVVHLLSWNNLRIIHDNLERYLNGEDLKEILDDNE
jgi:hypothetical protein